MAYQECDKWSLLFHNKFNSKFKKSKRLKRPLRKSTKEDTSEAESKLNVDVFYKAKHFQAFHYCYKLARDCKRHIEKIIKTNDVVELMSEDVFIKIRIVGKFTDADLKSISKGRAKREIPKDAQVWTVSPLVCFKNDTSPLSGFEILKENIGCSAILIIKSKCSDDENNKADMSHPNVVHTREQLLKNITTCLNKPIKEMLEGWLANLETEGSSKQAAGIKAEVEAIRKQIEFDDCDESAAVSVSPVVSTKSIVPAEVKHYLFSNSDVNSFGIWRDSSFKVFVKKATDEKRLKDELIYLNLNFFERYQLEIEQRKMVMKQTLMQGDAIQSKVHHDDDHYCEGTLGGFVTKVDDKSKIYALTCNHLFPEPNQLAYIEDHQNVKEIGFCVFTTRDKSCDFAAIEIKEAFVNKCDIALRRDDKMHTNAKVNTKRLENVGIVHKIGKATDVTTGIVLSPEYYDKVMDDNNREYIFLVKGTNGKFSEEGDSGSLVFCRPRSVHQTHVDILGMVFANNLTFNDNYDDDDADDDDENDERTKTSPSEGTLKSEVNAENTSCKSTSFETDSIDSADNAHGPENISCCYRIHTALELFEDSYSEQFKVKFQEDLSPSSNSDDSNEEPLE